MPTQQTELITFESGINQRKAPLYLEAGESCDASNFVLEHEGSLQARKALEVDIAYANRITGIHTYDIHKYVTTEGDMYDYATSMAFGMTGTEKTKFLDLEGITFVFDSTQKKMILDGGVYDWSISNPSVYPSVSAAATGSIPGDQYLCYYTFLITFNNGYVYETYLSPASNGGTPVVCSDPTSNTINWDIVPTMTNVPDYVASVHRKLYRGSTTLGDNYYVATISDNTTTTYVDTLANATLLGNGAYPLTGKNPVSTSFVDADIHLQRVFYTVGNTLYWTEAYDPLGVAPDNTIVVSKENEDLTCCVQYGDQLYMSSKSAWYRLQGSLPEQFQIKKPFTTQGCINRHTLRKTVLGIIFLGWDGVYMFDGANTKNITAPILGYEYWENVTNKEHYRTHAEWDEKMYYLYHTYNGLTRCLVIDFTTFPVLRCFFTDVKATAMEYSRENGIALYGVGNYLMKHGTGEVFSAFVKSKDLSFKNIFGRKRLNTLFYDIDTNGKDVVVTFIQDGVELPTTITLNTNGRERGAENDIPETEGYVYSIKISCEDAEGVVLYGPWGLQADLYGGD